MSALIVQRPLPDRRQSDRFISIYRSCCIVQNGFARPGLVRNVSRTGAKVEVGEDLQVGERITYYWDGIDPIEATVVWVEGVIAGLQNVCSIDLAEPPHRARPVRIPVASRARLWSRGLAFEVRIANISVAGACACDAPEIAVGTPVSLEIGRLCFENATVRWAERGTAGIRFAKALNVHSLDAAVRQLGIGPGPRADC